MKLPYRSGEWYELPAGDGSFAQACIMRVQHHVVDIAIFDRARSAAVAALRVSDRALVLHRWKRSAARGGVPALVPENAAWISPAHAERIAASRLGIDVPPDRPLEVRDVRSGEPVAGSILTWGAPLDDATLDSVKRHVAAHPGTVVRPRGGALEQLAAFAGSGVRSVALTAPYAGPALHGVAELRIERRMALAPLFARFPDLRAVRVAARGIDLAFKDLPRGVRAVDCSHAARVTLSGAPPLAALRLAHLDAAPDLRELPRSLRVLALEAVHLHELRPLYELAGLEQLELLGMWHLDLADAEPLLAMPALVRAVVDIGGRRKNVEIYKRARWAYPLPFPAVMERAALGNIE